MRPLYTNRGRRMYRLNMKEETPLAESARDAHRTGDPRLYQYIAKSRCNLPNTTLGYGRSMPALLWL